MIAPPDPAHLHLAHQRAGCQSRRASSTAGMPQRHAPTSATTATTVTATATAHLSRRALRRRALHHCVHALAAPLAAPLGCECEAWSSRRIASACSTAGASAVPHNRVSTGAVWRACL